MSDSYNNPGPGVPPPPPGTPFLPPTQPPTQPVYSNPTPAPAFLGDPHTLPVPGPPPGSGRSRKKMVGALVGVAALLGAGTFAVAQISSNDSSGGGASPQDVGNKFVKALDGEDLLGAVDLLLPGERDTFRQPLLDLVSELNRLEVTSNKVNLNKVPGFDISIQDPQIDVTNTNVDDIADITLTGTATVKVNGADIPIGNLLIDRVFNGDRPKIDSSKSSSDAHATFAVVKEGGRWYLSVFHTLAEKARGDQDIPKVGVKPAGATSPDGAVDQMIHAIGNLDLEKIIAGLNPNEAAALQRYAPLFLDKVQQQLDGQKVSLDIGKTEYAVTGSGNTRQVAITRLEATGSAGGTDVQVTLRDGCITATSGSTDFKTCAGDNNMDSSLNSYLDKLGMSSTPEFKKLVKDLRTSFSDFKEHGIVVDKVGGAWYVSPIGTGSELFLSVLRALDRDEIDTIINDGVAAFKSLAGSFDTSVFNGGSGGSGGSNGTDTTVTSDTVTSDTVTSDTSSTSNTDTVNSDGSGYWFDCLQNSSSTDVTACLQAGIEAGTWTAESVPAPYLYPKCGLFDYYNGSALYSDSAKQFHANVDPATSCITAAAAADGLDLLSSSPEFARPDCYAGVNPYNSDGDTDALDAALQCAYS